MIDVSTAQEYVDLLLRHFPARLSEWEDGFCRSLQRQLAEERPLTERQGAVLDALMERVAQEYGR